MNFNKNKVNYKGIDLFKIICALLVVAIHTEPGISNIWLDRVIGLFTRTAVPYFFVANGFFFEKGKNINKTLKRLFILYFVNIFINLPFVYTNVFTNFSVYKLLKILLIDGVNTHLWYLPASIIAITFYYLLSKFISKKKILVLSLLLFIFGVSISTYYPLIANYFDNRQIINLFGYRNGVFYGFFFVTLGTYIEEKVKEFNKNIYYYFFMLIFSFVLLIIESYFAVFYLGTKHTILWISQIPLAYYMFIISLKLNLKFSDKLSKLLRNSSTIIYNIHFLFIFILNKLNMFYGLSVFMIVSLLSFIASIVIIELSKNIKILKYLY